MGEAGEMAEASSPDVDTYFPPSRHTKIEKTPDKMEELEEIEPEVSSLPEEHSPPSRQWMDETPDSSLTIPMAV